MDDSDTETGLAFEPDGDWEPDIVRSAAEALAPMSLDLGNGRAAFAEKPEVDLGGIGERLRPDDGLQIGVDGDRLRDDLAKLKEHEADLKLRALLDKAERAYRAGQITQAWAHVKAALEIAPTNLPALLAGARCQHALSAFETALELLATARQHAHSGSEVALVLGLRDAAVARLVDAVGLVAAKLLAARRGPAAVEHVKRSVARHPDIPGLRYIYGAVLFQVGRLTEARDVVEAMLTEDGTIGDAFTGLHRAILFELCAPTIELARQSLRARRPKEAIDHLVACGDVLQTSQRYEWLWSYAHERYAKSAKMPFVGWRRARRSQAKPLDVDGLQEILVWLLPEEIDAGVEALRNSDYDGASKYCVRADTIDARCGTVAYLHAIAETCAADAVLKKIDLSTLAVAERRLTVAAQLATKIAVDPVLTDKGNGLVTRIAANRTEVARLTRFVGCISRFNALMTRLEHRRIQTRDELYRVKGELRSIQAAANASKREHESASSVRQSLDDLTGAVEALLRKLSV